VQLGQNSQLLLLLSSIITCFGQKGHHEVYKVGLRSLLRFSVFDKRQCQCFGDTCCLYVQGRTDNSLQFSTIKREKAGSAYISLYGEDTRECIMVKAPCYGPGGRGFEIRRGERIISICLIFPAELGPEVYSASKRNEYRKQRNNASGE
jgi:hypothetical protein